VNLRFLVLCEDIRMAIESIDSIVAGIPDLDAYRAIRPLRRAVEREFEIIGEATKHLLDEFPDTVFPDAPRIISLRNRIIHGYAEIDDGAIWGIAKTRLPGGQVHRPVPRDRMALALAAPHPLKGP
jgi:uncharacterized protein with HEPN domain